MKLCADVLHNVSSMPIDRDTSHCQFWACSEPVNMPKTIESPAKCGVHAVIRFLYSEKEGMLSSGIVLLHDNARPHTSAATKRFLKRFRWEVFYHPSSSARTWLPVIFISFPIWNGRRRTKFWYNELQTSVKNWLETQAAGFYDEDIGKLVPRYENVYVGASTM